MTKNKQQQINELDKLIGISKEIMEDDSDINSNESTPSKKPVSQESSPKENAIVVTDDREPCDLTADTFLEDMKRDYIDTRTTLKNLIIKGQTALDGIIDLSVEGEHPRAFEVAGTLITTIAKVSESLLELQKTVRGLTIQAGEGGVAGTQTPADSKKSDVLITGTFDDILHALEEAQQKKAKNDSIVSDQ